jgi:3'-phosphoadenosine 5'-phosphosulfate sulfotransferase (PAPS reductase)/FAD synthetase
VKNIASVSWGKDSLCMLLFMIHRGDLIDEVVFFNTGMEFKAIYKTRDRMLPILENKGIKYTELKPEKPFICNMFERPVNGKNGPHYGYSWCGGRCRWGTTEKLKALDTYCGDNHVYIGIAHDERSRIAHLNKSNKRFPLIYAHITEGEALLYCYQNGFDWEENGKPLYALLDRVSCWCCSNKNIKELRNYYHYLPEYWDKLKDLQSKTERPIKCSNMSVFDLEKKFRNEDKNANDK